MLNRVTIAGRLTADPEPRATKRGVVVTNFCVAVDRDYVDQVTGERGTDFIDVTAWRGLAEFVVTYFHKGDRVEVDGRLTVSDRTSKEGVKYRNVKVHADSIYFGGDKRKPAEAAVPMAEEPISNSAIEDDLEGDIPGEASMPEAAE